MLNSMIVDAKESDAAQIVDVINLSIKSCVADHKNDKKIIAQWLANKTENNVKDWIAEHYSLVFKADDDVNSKIAGFILVSQKGEILLNYVAPDRQRKGIGKQLLDHVKMHYKMLDVSALFAESTLTANPFYLNNGFKIVETVYEKEELVAYQMSAAL